MGTSVDVTAPDDSRVTATQQLFAEVEARCSRFLSTSELTRANQDPRPRVPISAELADVLTVASEARSMTDGLVDAGIGRAVESWGYDRTFDDVVDRPDDDLPSSGEVHDWRIEGSTLVRSPGTMIDLGGIAKGWTCDLAVERGLATIVSAGGDVRSADPTAKVEVVDPWGGVVITVALGIGALATSSVSRRRWRVADREANHLVDPRTMEPTRSPVLTASAVTRTAAEAEAAAKAILLHGAGGLRWADRQPWITSALVVWNDGRVYATTGLEVAA